MCSKRKRKKIKLVSYKSEYLGDVPYDLAVRFIKRLITNNPMYTRIDYDT